MDGTPGLQVVALHVARHDRPVLHGVDLTVPSGSLVAILGPSGSGKTTLLRAVAGLEPVSAGRIVLDGRDVTDREPGARGASMVFQGAPLHPRIDVGANLALPLRFHHVGEEEIARRVGAEARAFALWRLLDRLPGQISTGERQATATARSLVRAPELLLLDEPLAGLDERTRAAAMQQLATVQRGYGVTTLLASNDQRSAAGLAHEIVLLRDGMVVQRGSWTALLERPATTWVAGFLGDPPMNLIEVVAERDGPRTALVHGRLRHRTWDTRVPPPGGRAVLGIRPEHLEVVGDDDADVVGRVRLAQLLGPDGLVRLGIGGATEIVARLRRPLPSRGARVALRASRLHLFRVDGAAVGDLR